MKIGVKTYGDGKFLENFRKKADFFEVMALEGRDYSFLRQFSEVPIIIHAQHYIFGDNPADKSRIEKNALSINFARGVADLAGAKRIILHPGIISNGSCSEEHSASFIRSLKDKRIIIENQPHFKEFSCLCTTPENTGEFIRKTGTGLCLDINHAIETAFMKGIDCNKLIKEFIKLKPVHYHLGGQRLDKGADGRILSHLPFQDSILNLKEILGFLPENAEITLETEPDIEKTEDDLSRVRMQAF